MSTVVKLVLLTVAVGGCTKVDDWRTHCVDFPVFERGRAVSYRGLLTVMTSSDGIHVGTPRTTPMLIWRNQSDRRLFLRIEPMIFGIFESVCPGTVFVPADPTEESLDMSGQPQEWVCQDTTGLPATLVIQLLDYPPGGSGGDLQGGTFGGELVVPSEPIRYLLQLSGFEYETVPPDTC